MATTGVVLGGSMRVWVDDGGTFTVIGHATSSTLEFTRDTLEVSDKDNTSDWKEFLMGQKSGTLTTDAFFAYDTSNVKPTDIFDYWNNGTALTVYFSTEVAGDTRWDLIAKVTSFSITATVNEVTTCSLTMQVTGQAATETIT